MNQKYAAFLVFFLAVLVVYSNSLTGQFIWDDKVLILGNPLLKHKFNLPETFGSELYPGSGANYYRPLLSISFVLDALLFKFGPAGYHFTNIILHFAVSVLSYVFIKLLTKNKFLSFSTGLLFLLHPFGAQVVSYICGRADSLAGIFIMACLICYIKAVEKPVQTDKIKKNSVIARSDSDEAILASRLLRSLRSLAMTLFQRIPNLELLPSACFYFAAFLFFILALLSKESVIVLPIVVLGLHYFFKDGRAIVQSPQRRPALAVFFLIVLGYGILRLDVLNFSGGNLFLSKKGFSLLEVSFVSRAAIFFKTLLIYLGSFFIPLGLHMERIIVYEKIYFFHWIGLGIFLLLGAWAFREAWFPEGVAVECVIPRHSERSLRGEAKNPEGKEILQSAAGLFQNDKNSIAPQSSMMRCLSFFLFWFLAWLAPQSAFVFPAIMAEHFLYLSSLALCFLTAFCMQGIKKKRTKWLVCFLTAVYFGFITYAGNGYWREEVSFFQKTLEYTPQSARARDSLAALYGEAGRFEEAVGEYKRILTLDEKILREEDFDRFAREVLALARLEPEETKMLKSSAFYNIGVFFEKMSRFGDAFRAYNYALVIFPRMKQAYNNLGLLCARAARPQEAEKFYRQALRLGLQSQDAPVCNNLAALYAQKKEFKKAAALWQLALNLDPHYQTAKKNLALSQELLDF